MLELLLLFIEFFKTGLFAVGGGLATIPFLQEISEKHPHWFSSTDLTDMIAVAESTPGPIGVNMATFAGYRVAGVFGAVCTTFALVLPSFIIICIVYRILAKFSNSKYIVGSFYGIRPVVPGLIVAAIIPLFCASVINSSAATIAEIVRIDTTLLFLGVFVAFSHFKKVHPLVFIAFGAVIGIIFKM